MKKINVSQPVLEEAGTELWIEKNIYRSPAIIAELTLETRAGSPLSEIDNLFEIQE